MTLTGKGHVFGLTGGTIALKDADGTTTITGYISPNLQSLRLSAGAKKDMIPNQAGNTASAIFWDESVECTFDFVAEGTTVANAKLSGRIPQAGYFAALAGLPIIPFATFADVFNSGAWLYEGEGSFNIGAEKKLEGSITLRRYTDLAAGAVIT
jgi:hypothetical protein